MWFIVGNESCNDNKNKLVSASDSYLKEMTDIATLTDGLADTDFSYLTSENATKQLKVFLLSLARNELLRVIRLTEALNDLESTFVKEALDNKEDINLGVLSEIMRSVMNSLNRSTDLVYKVMNDESIKLIIDNSTNIFNSSQSIVILQDKSSRERVKQIAHDIIDRIQQNNAEVIDTDINVEDVNENSSGE